VDILFSFGSIFLILILIVLVCVIFTNAVEHLGEELKLGEGAVGSILAAVGTALPETIVPLVAILGAYFTGGDVHQAEAIGIGGILGAPFLLGTLAFFVTGLAVYIFTKSGRRTLDMPVNSVIILRDLHYFAIAYTIAILSSFISYHPIKHVMAVGLLVIYGVYLVKTIKNDACENGECDVEALAPLYLTKFFKTPQNLHLFFVSVQLLLSLIGIIVLAHFFVEDIKFLSDHLSINPMILSLIIIPIATELPEKFNSVIWIRAKKDTLSMGNITGAMVFQSCIPTAVGLSLTPWVLNADGLVNAVIVYLSVGVVYYNIIRNKGILKPSALLSGGFFYCLYLLYVAFKVLFQG
jgi:cation:H+ antiporter